MDAVPRAVALPCPPHQGPSSIAHFGLPPHAAWDLLAIPLHPSLTESVQQVVRTLERVARTRSHTNPGRGFPAVPLYAHMPTVLVLARVGSAPSLLRAQVGHDPQDPQAAHQILRAFVPPSSSSYHAKQVEVALDALATAFVVAHQEHQHATNERRAYHASHLVRQQYRADVRTARQQTHPPYSVPTPPPKPPKPPKPPSRIPSAPPPTWHRSLLLIGPTPHSHSHSHPLTWTLSPSWTDVHLAPPLLPPRGMYALRPIRIVAPSSSSPSAGTEHRTKGSGIPSADHVVRAILDTWTYNVVLRRGVRLPSAQIPSVLLQADTSYVVRATLTMSTSRIQVQLHTQRIPHAHVGFPAGVAMATTTPYQSMAVPLGIPVQVRAPLLDPLTEEQRLLLRDVRQVLPLYLSMEEAHQEHWLVLGTLDSDPREFLWPASLVLHQTLPPPPPPRTNTIHSSASIQMLAQHTSTLLECLSSGSRTTVAPPTEPPPAPAPAPAPYPVRRCTAAPLSPMAYDDQDDLDPIFGLSPSNVLSDLLRDGITSPSHPWNPSSSSHLMADPEGPEGPEGPATHSTYHTTPCTPADIPATAAALPGGTGSTNPGPSQEQKGGGGGGGSKVGSLLPPPQWRNRYVPRTGPPTVVTPEGTSLVTTPLPAPPSPHTVHPANVQAKYNDGKFALVDLDLASPAPATKEHSGRPSAVPSGTKDLLPEPPRPRTSVPRARPLDPWVSSSSDDSESDTESETSGSSPVSDAMLLDEEQPLHDPKMDHLRSCVQSTLALVCRCGSVGSAAWDQDLFQVQPPQQNSSGATRTTTTRGNYREHHEPNELRVPPTSDRTVERRIPIDWVPNALSFLLEQPLPRPSQSLILGDGADCTLAPHDELSWALSVLELDTHPAFNVSSWVPTTPPSSSGVPSESSPKRFPTVPTRAQLLHPPQLQTSLHTAPATLTLNLAGFPFWSTLGLGPLSGRKDVKSVVLVPSDSTNARRVGRVDPNTWATQNARTHDLWAQVECWARGYERMNLGTFEVVHQVVHVPRSSGPADWVSSASDLSSILQKIGTLLGQLSTESESESESDKTPSYVPSYVILWLSRGAATSSTRSTSSTSSNHYAKQDSREKNVKIWARQVAALQASIRAHLSLSNQRSHHVVVRCLPDATTLATPTPSQILRLYESLPEDAVRAGGATANPFPEGTVDTDGTEATNKKGADVGQPTMVGPAFSLVPAPWPNHDRSCLQFRLHWPLVFPRDQVATLHVAYARSRSHSSLWIALMDGQARHWDIHCAPLSSPSSGSASAQSASASMEEEEEEVVKTVWEYTKRSTIRLGQRLSMLIISALDPLEVREHQVWQAAIRTDRPAWVATIVLVRPFQRMDVHVPLHLGSGIRTKPVPNDPPTRFGLSSRPRPRTKPTTTAGEVLTYHDVQHVAYALPLFSATDWPSLGGAPPGFMTSMVLDYYLANPEVGQWERTCWATSLVDLWVWGERLTVPLQGQQDPVPPDAPETESVSESVPQAQESQDLQDPSSDAEPMHIDPVRPDPSAPEEGEAGEMGEEGEMVEVGQKEAGEAGEAGEAPEAPEAGGTTPHQATDPTTTSHTTHDPLHMDPTDPEEENRKPEVETVFREALGSLYGLVAAARIRLYDQAQMAWHCEVVNLLRSL